MSWAEAVPDGVPPPPLPDPFVRPTRTCYVPPAPDPATPPCERRNPSPPPPPETAMPSRRNPILQRRRIRREAGYRCQRNFTDFTHWAMFVDCDFLYTLDRKKPVISIAKRSLADELQELRKWVEQLRLEKEKTEETLRQRDEILKQKEEDLENRGKEQERLQPDLKKLRKLKEFNPTMSFPLAKSFREKEQEKPRRRRRRRAKAAQRGGGHARFVV